MVSNDLEIDPKDGRRFLESFDEITRQVLAAPGHVLRQLLNQLCLDYQRQTRHRAKAIWLTRE